MAASAPPSRRSRASSQAAPSRPLGSPRRGREPGGSFRPRLSRKRDIRGSCPPPADGGANRRPRGSARRVRGPRSRNRGGGGVRPRGRCRASRLRRPSSRRDSARRPRSKDRRGLAGGAVHPRRLSDSDEGLILVNDAREGLGSPIPHLYPRASLRGEALSPIYVCGGPRDEIREQAGKEGIVEARARRGPVLVFRQAGLPPMGRYPALQLGRHFRRLRRGRAPFSADRLDHRGQRPARACSRPSSTAYGGRWSRSRP